MLLCTDVLLRMYSHTFPSSQSPFPSTPTTKRALQRTLSDESIYSGQREHFFTSRASLLDQALPNDVLFSSTYPSLPKSLPLRRPSYTLGMKSLHGKYMSSLITVKERCHYNYFNKKQLSGYLLIAS